MRDQAVGGHRQAVDLHGGVDHERAVGQDVHVAGDQLGVVGQPHGGPVRDLDVAHVEEGGVAEHRQHRLLGDVHLVEVHPARSAGDQGARHEQLPRARQRQVGGVQRHEPAGGHLVAGAVADVDVVERVVGHRRRVGAGVPGVVDPQQAARGRVGVDGPRSAILVAPAAGGRDRAAELVVCHVQRDASAAAAAAGAPAVRAAVAAIGRDRPASGQHVNVQPNAAAGAAGAVVPRPVAPVGGHEPVDP